jgi:hypothetical protein
VLHLLAVVRRAVAAAQSSFKKFFHKKTFLLKC